MSDALEKFILNKTTHFVRGWSDNHIDVIFDDANYDLEDANRIITAARKRGFELVRVFDRDDSIMFRFEGDSE